jgi:hypothetical protein
VNGQDRSACSGLATRAAILALTLTTGCSREGAFVSGEGRIESVPLATRSGGEGPLFESLPAAATGVSFENRFDWANERKHLYQHGYAGGGVCVGDYDGDGRPDLYLVSQIERDRLYRQVGDFAFVDVTDEAGLNGGDAWGTGATFVDIDNDGDLDLYV